ncbi:SEC-C domain-containing protein [Halomonas campisalis]|uniref:SEC-C domain-containing protein n=1 Tax=Billgrantia campisalis TaxID=74661 RepID=A0ABS9P807_9GAMM|nr:SEC-C metal-binding domain-containing protein [Halomonas campisalis]MCG6657906.1 SEC-C domain-containing protein [Halomonas campisalis]MDR5863570.1 SEC-C domain-containing protein [Halomonas campisalis]
MLAVWVEQLLGFASGALEAIREDEHYPALMAWARDEGAAQLGNNLPLAQALAPELWSQTPLERAGFACEPLARPGRNEPCWCDSGRKTKHCCGAVTLPGEVPSHLMWMLSLRDWKGPTLKAALESGRAPAQALLEAGLIAAETGQRGRAQQILESLFQRADWSRLPSQAEPAFELLIDLYQERGFTRKRADLLDEVLERGPLFLRGVALERLCLMHLDSDDLDSARAAFVRAQQALPDSPTLAYIEAMLLLHEGHEQEAGERARFWFRRLSRQGELDPDQLQFLADLAENPGATLADQLLNAEEDLAEPLAALQALLAELPPAPGLDVRHTPEGELEYHSTAREDTLFAAFQVHFEAAVDEESALGFEADPWLQAGTWLRELCAHPEWLDSPRVVQSLALALTSRFGSLPWMSPSLFEPLADRLERWLMRIRGEGEGPFLWDSADNAVLLRTGLALVVGMERGARERSRRLAERLLSLDDQDSLGLQELVLDQLLREGRDQEALAMTEAYLDQAPVLGMLMGRALALYRLERYDEAAAVLGQVARHNAHALAMLCAENPRPVAAAQDVVAEPGSRAEAWQYRTLMRDQWRATPGALAWLHEHLE